MLELVTVMMIVGVVAAIAIPRLGDFSTRSQAAVLKQNLAILTKAIEHYRAEHGGDTPPSDKHLMLVTDSEGNIGTDASAGFVLGPYLDEIPPLPVGSLKGTRGIAFGGSIGADGEKGWFFDPATGRVRANLTDAEVTSDGVKLNTIISDSAVVRVR